MIYSEHEISALAPSGALRATINLGNPILAREEDGKAAGVSVDLARALAAALGIALELIVLDAAGKAVDAVVSGQADIGFFAIDPVRGEDIEFTAPYILIEGCYMVRDDSPIRDNNSVDQPGIRVAVGKGSAYDLYLSRELKRAEIVRPPTSPTVVDIFVGQELEVAAGVRQQLESDALRIEGLRILPDRFMVIQQAMGLRKRNDPTAHRLLATFVEHAKRAGLVRDALRKHQIVGAAVAPPVVVT
jgi:polar amino acid transport system substrate-binding protein